MQHEGLPVESLPPMGAIYLTVRIAPFGKRTPGRPAPATPTRTCGAYLLEAADFAVVPFQAFGMAGDSGWFRLSVGAVSEAEIRAALPRVAAALRALT